MRLLPSGVPFPKPWAWPGKGAPTFWLSSLLFCPTWRLGASMTSRPSLKLTHCTALGKLLNLSELIYL